jgi:hypothetical protein
LVGKPGSKRLLEIKWEDVITTNFKNRKRGADRLDLAQDGDK